MIALDLSNRVEEFCHRWKVSELSVARASSDTSSDPIGLFARFDPMTSWSLVDRLRMQEELSVLLSRPVVLRSRHAHEIRRGLKQRPMQVVYNC
jgi:predicted nucleotidyltransferase